MKHWSRGGTLFSSTVGLSEFLAVLSSRELVPCGDKIAASWKNNSIYGFYFGRFVFMIQGCIMGGPGDDTYIGFFLLIWRGNCLDHFIHTGSTTLKENKKSYSYLTNSCTNTNPFPFLAISQYGDILYESRLINCQFSFCVHTYLVYITRVQTDI